MGIGNKLKKIMAERGTNANELSKITGVPAQTIYSLIRRDAKKVDIDSLIKIAHALGTTADYFCSEELENDSNYEPTTIAAHHDGEWSEDELDEIEKFKEYVKSKRENE